MNLCVFFNCSLLEIYLYIFVIVLLKNLELQRYFEAAESAAKEVLLEELKPLLGVPNNAEITLESIDQQIQQGLALKTDIDENDGVFQLTTIGSLPLKSPKRMVALQLANSNPLFRSACTLIFF